MRKYFHGCLAVLWMCLILSVSAAGSLTWRGDRVDADIHSADLPMLLQQIATATGWQVYLEPGTTHDASAKFNNLQPGEALRLLLGDLNFALVPQTNGSPRLFVFRTAQGNATRRILPATEAANKHRGQKIPGELVVRLKPGANIDELARALGAKVVGRIDELNAYRLQFSDESAAENARQKLGDNPDVTAVDYNYSVDPLPSAMRLDSASVPPLRLSLNPPDGSKQPIVGLIDTTVQPLGNDLDKFLIKSISVAGEANPDPNSPTHGTSMYQDILRAAASVTGGSSSMQVLSVDVYGPNSSTSTFDVAKGIVLAVNNGANIINLSLGSPGDSPFLKDLVQQVAQKDIPIFAAAGNDASPEPFYPAAYPGVISVTAAAGPGHLAPYANYGSFINLIAPGSSVVYFGNSAFLVNGTSASAAFISGMTGGMADSKHTTTMTAAGAIGQMPNFQFAPHK